MSIVSAVKMAVEHGGIDGEWRGPWYIGERLATAHSANENFSLCSGHDARNDYYAMWHEQKKRQYD